MSEANDMAFFERMLAEHPEMANWTVNDLDAEICRLRAKIEPEPSDPKYLVTVRGLGYKFEA